MGLKSYIVIVLSNLISLFEHRSNMVSDIYDFKNIDGIYFQKCSLKSINNSH